MATRYQTIIDVWKHLIHLGFCNELRWFIRVIVIHIHDEGIRSYKIVLASVVTFILSSDMIFFDRFLENFRTIYFYPVWVVAVSFIPGAVGCVNNKIHI